MDLDDDDASRFGDGVWFRSGNKCLNEKLGSGQSRAVVSSSSTSVAAVKHEWGGREAEGKHIYCLI